MSIYSQNQYFTYGLVIVVATILCLVNLGGHPIYILDEAKNAEAAREMFMSNNWIIPTYNGELRTDKPVLHYWLMMIAYKLFGVNAFAARFFSAIFGVFTIVSTFHFTQKFTNKKLALTTVFVLCSSIFFMQEFHLAVPDPFLIFFISFGLFNFFDFYKNNQKLNWLLMYISFGLGVLVKGPIALALPGLIIFLFLLFKKEFNVQSVLRINPFLGLILSLLICVPWYYQVHLATNGAFTKGFFLQHNLQRFSGEMEGHGGLPFVTWAFVLLGLLPFSFFIIQGFVQSWKHRRKNDFILFSFLVSASFILFFSVSSTKLPNYPMPSYPFIAILIGYYFQFMLQNKTPDKGFKVSFWFIFGISIVLPIGGFVALTWVEVQLKTANYVSIILLPLTIGSILGFIYLKRNQIQKSLISIGIGSMLVIIGLFTFAYPKLTALSPVSLAKKQFSPKDQFIIYRGYDPAFLFNLERTFPIANNREEIENLLMETPNAYIITKEKFLNSDWNDVKSTIHLKQKSLFENYTTVIFRIDEQ